MKVKAAIFAAGIAGLGLSVAMHPTSPTVPLGATLAYPADCIVAIPAAPGYLPRAAFTVENNRDQAIQVWVEAREGMGLARLELGTVTPLEQKTFPNALPTGRNIVSAKDGASRRMQQVLYVNHRGVETCRRRYLWRIE